MSRNEQRQHSDPPGAVSDQNREEAERGHRDDGTAGGAPDETDSATSGPGQGSPDEGMRGGAGEGSQATGHPGNAG